MRKTRDSATSLVFCFWALMSVFLQSMAQKQQQLVDLRVSRGSAGSVRFLDMNVRSCICCLSYSLPLDQADSPPPFIFFFLKDFCEVTEDFIEDDFNLTGLSGLVPFYKEALDMVLDVEPVDADLKVPDVSIVESSAELLYGLIHQRFIITRPGLAAMAHKYEHGHFGYCPRVYCSNTRVLPVGRSDLPGVDTVKLFCPSCVDIYAPPSSRFQGVDGSFFGTTLPHLLLHSYKDTAAGADLAPASYSGGRNRIYTPKIYGFRVSDRAKSGPRMMWLRMKPSDPSEVVSHLPQSVRE